MGTRKITQIENALFWIKEWECEEHYILELKTNFLSPRLLIYCCLLIWIDISPICYLQSKERDKYIYRFYSVYGNFSLSADFETNEIFLSAANGAQTLQKLSQKLIRHKSVRYGK